MSSDVMGLYRAAKCDVMKAKVPLPSMLNPTPAAPLLPITPPRPNHIYTRINMAILSIIVYVIYDITYTIEM